MITTYFADTNFYLRFLLQDVMSQATKTEKLLKKVRDKNIIIIFLPEVILEMVFVLESFYKAPRSDIAEKLTTLIKTEYLNIQHRSLWIKAFEIFEKSAVSMFDIYLFLRAKDDNSKILSYDKDFVKLNRIIKTTT